MKISSSLEDYIEIISEIIEENGEYYITTCGWRDKPVANKGCVSIAPLAWK